MSDNEQSQQPQVQEKKKSGFLTALIGFGAGAVVGAVTALLLAPASGKETREKIKDRMGDVSDKAGELIDRSKEAFEEAKDRMSTAYEDAVEKTSSMVEKAKQKISGKKNEDEEGPEV